MTWAEHLSAVAAHLDGESLDYAWDFLSHDSEFCKKVAANPNLSSSQRQSLLTSKDPAVRGAFARREDLDERESSALSQDRCVSVISQWLSTHQVDPESLLGLVTRDSAAIMDILARDSLRLGLQQAPASLLGALTARVNSMKHPVPQGTVEGLCHTLKQACPTTQDEVAGYLEGKASANSDLTEKFLWLGCESEQSPSSYRLATTFISTLGPAHRGRALDILNRWNLEPGEHLDNITAGKLSELIKDQDCPNLESLVAQSKPLTDPLETLACPGASSFQKSQALVMISRSRPGNLYKGTWQVSVPVAAQALSNSDKSAAHHLASWVVAYQWDWDQTSQYDYAQLLQALDSVDREWAVRMLQAGPQVAPRRWWKMSLPEGLLPDVPLGLLRSTLSESSVPAELVLWLAQQAGNLQDCDRGEVNALLEGLYPTFPGSARQLLEVIQDTLNAGK